MGAEGHGHTVCCTLQGLYLVTLGRDSHDTQLPCPGHIMATGRQVLGGAGFGDVYKSHVTDDGEERDAAMKYSKNGQLVPRQPTATPRVAQDVLQELLASGKVHAAAAAPTASYIQRYGAQFVVEAVSGGVFIVRVSGAIAREDEEKAIRQLQRDMRECRQALKSANLKSAQEAEDAIPMPAG